ncbi:hypothetical protein I6N90_18835 [Paenibacillus sp. GSMTC-2017]|uniref:hypothetical protein n=1 Tax=Paenibacillus sp. GSMTC-2017 TaxID=2794350 RepID=UPI0018D82C1F|nr:hypothetical protein [Paenibacillus sp. GSMTC-2017]MBH5319860.1 hypothetical protein [Paenibacillus sp. GSMTC-2017]
MWRYKGSRYKQRIWRLVLVGALCSVVTLTGGCSGGSVSEKNSYKKDGYMGYSNTNPNVLNKHSSLSYKDDVRLIEQVLLPVKGIKRLKISFNGSLIQVGIQPKKGLSVAEVEKVRSETQAIVQSNMPEYDVYVKVNR